MAALPRSITSQPIRGQPSWLVPPTEKDNLLSMDLYSVKQYTQEPPHTPTPLITACCLRRQELHEWQICHAKKLCYRTIERKKLSVWKPISSADWEPRVCFFRCFCVFSSPVGLSASRNHNGSLYVSVATTICQTTAAERNREGKKTSSPYKSPSPVGSQLNWVKVKVKLNVTLPFQWCGQWQLCSWNQCWLPSCFGWGCSGWGAANI